MVGGALSVQGWFATHVRVCNCPSTCNSRWRPASIQISPLLGNPHIEKGFDRPCLHVQLDAIAEHLLASDRGVSFTMYRPEIGEWPPRVALRTDFLVSARVDAEVQEVAKAVGAGDWLNQQAEECFPPAVVTVDMDALGQAIGAEENRGLYEQRSGDRNLASRPELFRLLASHLDWSELCASAPTLARNLLDAHPLLVEMPVRAATDLRTRVETANETRLARRRAGGFVDGTEDFGRLLKGLPDRLDLSIEVLGCGATFIGDPDLLRES